MADENKFLVAVAVIAVAVAVVASVFTYYSIADLSSQLSGYAAATGYANLTVESVAAINFTTNTINWQSGRVNSGQTYAILSSVGEVVYGNWTTVTSGLVLENIGNTNVTLDLASGSDAATFLGGTSPSYKWNISNVEANSCVNASDPTAGMDAYVDVNNTSPGTRFCSSFKYKDSSDRIKIDINLTVPYDSITGALSDTITATATSI